ncbi:MULTISPECIES: lipase family protein [unclassified Rhodococcus (in: high G+C Gram-positive bacteria)]|uniref:lipase family protein n=1 Tax=unclassified Rhodococcus (in: high G+C Gram-positive bacteria) TaxID=192944 RepID=UPI0006FF2B39|nr:MULTISPECIES: lipase family protein [unclassified Rhodococcus (in: high G+C Gram-positive bacteria)]KQU35993.1 lipase [Rhodococcus sp. Leaf225]KQU48541.1 lipase [Rhodococcus sp. Leaf258]MDQ1199759.1 triacylglycerol lipase [Rhodococcus sp. SORGH_AS_0303]
MRSIRRLVLAAVTAAVVAAALPGTAAADAQYPTPNADPFYSAPGDISGLAPGTVLASRPMPNPPNFIGVSTWQLAFRSTGSEGNPIVGVTTVFVPLGKAPDGPLLSYQQIVNALGLKCAPSQALWSTDPNVVIRDAAALNAVFTRGWSVSMPDHLGPNSAYGAAKLGGQITLDGIRAAKNFDPLQLRNSPVGMGGYSGGGMATAWAAALAPSYAPELNIVGSAQGGVPMNLLKMAYMLGENTPHPVFGLALAAAIGLGREYPDRMPVSQNLTPQGTSMMNQIADSCTNDILAVGANHSAAEITANKSVFADPQGRAVVEENSVELYPGVPRAPIFEWHSPTDGLIPVDAIDSTTARYCSAGARVQTLLTPTPDHLSGALLGLPSALQWLNDRFAGLPAPSTC